MTRTFLIPVSILFLLLALIPPVSSTVILSDVSFTPTGPLAGGSQQHVVATYAIIPSGASTFAAGHSLQMETDLVGAKWSIQVTLDGRDAAHQSATGNVAFVNGELLSYPTSHDVGMIVTIDGTVPQTEGDQLMVLQLEELDNSGNLVPGSVITINQAMAGQPVPASGVPTLTPPVVTPAVPVTRSPGFAGIMGITGCALAVIAWMRRRND